MLVDECSIDQPVALVILVADGLIVESSFWTMSVMLVQLEMTKDAGNKCIAMKT